MRRLPLIRRRFAVITGPSGVGKDSVIEQLRRLVRVQRVVTTTSRPKRVQDRPYHHVSRAQFRQMIARHAFVEWAVVYGHLYGTTHDALRGALRKPGLVILANDPQGAITIKKLYPEAVTIFLSPPSLRSLSARLRGRKQDAPNVILRRLVAAKKEMRLAKRFDAAIVNRDGKLAETAARLLRLLRRP